MGGRLETMRSLSDYAHPTRLLPTCTTRLGWRSLAAAMQTIYSDREGGGDRTRDDVMRAFEIASALAVMGDNEKMPCHLGSVV